MESVSSISYTWQNNIRKLMFRCILYSTWRFFFHTYNSFIIRGCVWFVCKFNGSEHFRVEFFLRLTVVWAAISVVCTNLWRRHVILWDTYYCKYISEYIYVYWCVYHNRRVSVCWQRRTLKHEVSFIFGEMHSVPIQGDCLWADSTFSRTRTKHIYIDGVHRYILYAFG